MVTPDGVLDDGWVSVEGGRIAGTGRGPAPPAIGGLDLGGRWLLPGFVDVHVHGGGGHDMAASPEDMAGAVAFHRRHGTTRTLVSLVTAPPDALVEHLGWVADAVAAGPGPSGHVIGAHLEGPFHLRSAPGRPKPGPHPDARPRHLRQVRRRRAGHAAQHDHRPRTARCHRGHRRPPGRGRRGRHRALRRHLRRGVGRYRRRGHAWPPTCSTACAPCTTASPASSGRRWFPASPAR